MWCWCARHRKVTRSWPVLRQSKGGRGTFRPSIMVYCWFAMPPRWLAFESGGIVDEITAYGAGADCNGVGTGGIGFGNWPGSGALDGDHEIRHRRRQPDAGV